MAARHAALEALSTTSDLTGVTKRGLKRSRVHFVYLHGVQPDQEHQFRRLIRYLKAEHTVISYSDAVDRVLEDRVDGRYVCVSFDDGFASCLNAARILTEEEVSACFFVCPGLVGLDRQHLLPIFPNGLGVEQRTLDWDEILSLARNGHEIGSHTMTHPTLSSIEEQQIVKEVNESHEALLARLGDARHFAWPRGQFRHFTSASARIVHEAGYRSCASAERGAHSQGVRPDEFPCIRRDHIDLSWPFRHMRYFIGRSALRCGIADNAWPTSWNVTMGPTS